MGQHAWDGHRLGAQFLAEALAEHTPVLFVDPPKSLTALTRTGPSGLRATFSAPRVSLIGPRLARLSPIGPPAKTRPGVRSMTDLWLARTVRRAVDALGGSVRAVISGYLYCNPFGHCDERSRLFRASDDFSTGAELGIPVRFMTRSQARLAASSDLVVCVSPLLAERWRASGHRTALVPNGCDSGRLREAADLERPADVRLADPIVGYVGQLASRVDIALLRAVAERGRSLMLVGGIRSDLDRESVRDLLERPNVQFVGARPYDDVPSYLGAMAVGLVPYTNSAFNQASFPLKLLEYLAAGLPVVSTDLPSVRWLDSDLVRVATEPRAFADAVESAIAASDDVGERGRRLDLAARHSWASRAADYLSVLDGLDQQRPA